VFPGRERKKSEPLHGNAPKKESLSAQITAMEKFLFRGKPGGWVAAGLAGLFFFFFFFHCQCQKNGSEKKSSPILREGGL
jgi:hypothetical protein